VVPKDLIVYFTTSAQIAGSSIGLLFVSISLRYDAILGRSAQFHSRAMAAAAFTGFHPRLHAVRGDGSIAQTGLDTPATRSQQRQQASPGRSARSARQAFRADRERPMTIAAVFLPPG
jgi:hypothetical protein